MSNTVKTNRSDEMLKSLVAQIASQSVAIIMQCKREAQDARPSDAETDEYVAELGIPSQRIRYMARSGQIASRLIGKKRMEILISDLQARA